MEKKPRRRGQRPEDFKVRIVYSELTEEQKAEEIRKMEDWVNKVLFTDEYRKSTKKN
jgi:hypothetical protein